MAKRPSKKTAREKKKLAFRFDAPEAQNVSVAGDFNGWDVEALPMKKMRGGTWKASVELEPGRYEYRYYVDGSWQEDPNCQESVSNPFGGRNSVASV